MQNYHSSRDISEKKNRQATYGEEMSAKHAQSISLFAVVTVYNVTLNNELGDIEPWLLGEIQD